jgi:hypothetical protein
MSAAPLALLKLLASVPNATSRPAPPKAGEGTEFRSLLERAQRGEVSSGLPVTIAPGAAVTLSENQLTRLGDAADRAEAQGASRALVLIDGLALRLDVGVREVTGAAEIKADTVLTGIDAVISVGSGGDSASTGPIPLPRAGAGPLNPSLLDLLARNERD